MRIGFTFDTKTDWPARPGDPVDVNAEFDSPATIDFIARAIESGGHTVQRIGNARRLLARLGGQDGLDVDLVFNICEGRNGRTRESEVPVLLEMMGIPYVGADGLSLGVTLDKAVAKKCFVADGIPTPGFLVAESPEAIGSLDGLSFPLIVKNSREGTSKGLIEESVVRDAASLRTQVERIVTLYHQPAIVEEFIRGGEFTVAVLGNTPPEAMPVVRSAIQGCLVLGDRFFTNAMVLDDNVACNICPAQISPELEAQLQALAVRAYQSVGCRDFGRVDFRVDEQGRPYVLEINPLPSLAEKDIFNVFPPVVGMTYAQVINRIIQHAADRYGLNQTRKSSAG